MKIVYDVSVLGVGQRHERARTGIYRVVENVTHTLAKRAECELYLSASESYDTIDDCVQYLRTQPALAHVPLLYAEARDFRKSIKLKQKELMAEYGKAPPLRAVIRSKSIRNFAQNAKLTNRLERRALEALDKFSLNNPLSVDHQRLAAADIFHSSYYSVPELSSQARRAKKFLTVHDLIPVLQKHLFGMAEDHWMKRVIEALTKDDWIISVSQSTKNDLCNYSREICPDHVIVAHNGVSELFAPQRNAEIRAAALEKYGIPEDVPYLLSVSTLEPRKNLDHVIKSFRTLVQQEHISNLNLVLVGTKGWDYDKVFEALEMSGPLAKRVILTGFVDDQDLAAIYSGALAFVYMPLYEGFGLPPLEAMRCGIPVVVSNNSSLPEVVGDAGIMLDAHDVAGLCESMLKLYQSPTLREKMAEASLKRAEPFTWENSVDAMIVGYKKALEN